MSKDMQSLATALVHVPLIALLGYAAYQRLRFGSSRPRFVGAPFKAFKLFAALGLIAALTACSNADPLPVAQGPLYQLNGTNWHATPQDLSAPPKVANN